MKISYDDQYMFSVGQDGVLFCFRVMDKDGRGLKKEKDVNFSEEVLVTKSDLEEKVCVQWGGGGDRGEEGTGPHAYMYILVDDMRFAKGMIRSGQK